MSMISAQVERLREIADFLESDPKTQATAPEVRRAADTIWEMRNKLAGTVDQSEEIERLKRENTELRQERDHLLASESPMASEALADVRGWLCDNLSTGDAGKVCGMLSVVSRHITELEDENARLRSCLSDDAENARQIMGENAKLRELVRIMHGELVSCEDNGYVCGGHKFDDRVREFGIEVKDD